MRKDYASQGIALGSTRNKDGIVIGVSTVDTLRVNLFLMLFRTLNQTLKDVVKNSPLPLKSSPNLWKIVAIWIGKGKRKWRSQLTGLMKERATRLIIFRFLRFRKTGRRHIEKLWRENIMTLIMIRRRWSITRASMTRWMLIPSLQLGQIPSLHPYKGRVHFK